MAIGCSVVTTFKRMNIGTQFNTLTSLGRSGRSWWNLEGCEREVGVTCKKFAFIKMFFFKFRLLTKKIHLFELKLCPFSMENYFLNKFHPSLPLLSVTAFQNWALATLPIIANKNIAKSLGSLEHQPQYKNMAKQLYLHCLDSTTTDR